MNNTNEINEFIDDINPMDIVKLLKDMWKYKFLVLGLILVCMSVVAVKKIYFTPYTYTSDSTLYVSNRASVSDNTEVVNKSDIDTARTMSETYIETLKTREFLMDVSNMVGENYSWEQIKKMMSVSAINETELLSVRVTANSQEDAYKIAKVITMLAPEKLSSVCEGGSIHIIDKAFFPTAPNGKGTLKDVSLSGIVGILLAAMIIYIFGLFDTKVQNSEDVAKKYDISILGELSL